MNPQAPKDVVEYSFKHGGFVPVPPAPSTVTIVHLEGYAILKESPEAQEQIAAGYWDGKNIFSIMQQIVHNLRIANIEIYFGSVV